MPHTCFDAERPRLGQNCPRAVSEHAEVEGNKNKWLLKVRSDEYKSNNQFNRYGGKGHAQSHQI